MSPKTYDFFLDFFKNHCPTVKTEKRVHMYFVTSYKISTYVSYPEFKYIEVFAGFNGWGRR